MNMTMMVVIGKPGEGMEMNSFFIARVGEKNQMTEIKPITFKKQPFGD